MKSLISSRLSVVHVTFDRTISIFDFSKSIDTYIRLLFIRKNLQLLKLDLFLF